MSLRLTLALGHVQRSSLSLLLLLLLLWVSLPLSLSMHHSLPLHLSLHLHLSLSLLMGHRQRGRGARLSLREDSLGSHDTPRDSADRGGKLVGSAPRGGALLVLQQHAADEVHAVQARIQGAGQDGFTAE